MRRQPQQVVPLALVVALLVSAPAVAATAPTTKPATRATSVAKPKPKPAKSNGKAKGSATTAKPKPAKPKPAKPKPPVVSRGLDTILQDDGLFLFRPADEVTAAVERAKALGIDTIRLTAGWSSLTRGVDQATKPAGFDARDPGAYEQARWQALDTAVRAIHAAGLHALIDIAFWAPRWATTDPGPRARANINPQDFADFATAVALRYSGAFTPPVVPVNAPVPAPTPDESIIEQLLQPIVPFPIPPLPGVSPAPNPPPASADPRAVQALAAQATDSGAQAPNERLPKVDEFALWNEPNHQGLLLPQWEADGNTPASPPIYRAMVRDGYAAVKAVRSKAQVLIGNTSSTGGTRGSGPVPPLEFLRDLACVDRDFHPMTTPDCQNYTMLPGDGWAHHPYSQNERPSRTSQPPKELDDVRLADLPQLATTLDILVKMGRLAPADRNIYITEFGYETQPVPGRPTISELTQARWLTWAEYLADKLPAVRSFAQFLLRDQPPSPTKVSDSKARPYGQYSTGLLHADGSDKIAAKTFVAGLFAQLRSEGRVLLYGRLRLGAGTKTITIQRQVPHGSWEKIDTLKIDGRSSFTWTIPHTPGTVYRLGYPAPGGTRTSSIAIKPVAATA